MQADDIWALVSRLDDAWYDECEGSYGHVPTWGPETDTVRSLIGSSCAEGDLVSWDTRSADPVEHLYLRRYWRPDHQGNQSEHVFSIGSHAEILGGDEY
jgi:hypothetical protein